jgi:hypothetical protein
MQSCPKNVHTGPLIGSNKTKTNKGPVTTNHHLVANPLEPTVAVAVTNSHLATPTSSSTASISIGSAASKNIICKQEGGDTTPNIKIKGENEPSAKTSSAHQHHISNHLHPYHHSEHGAKFAPQQQLLLRPSTLSQHRPGDKDGMTYEKVGLAPLPNYSLNININEPELSISPARGSTGLSLPLMQAEATQPQIETGSLPRRPRIGKLWG